MKDSILNFNNLNDYYDFLVEHKLTHEQFVFLYTLLLDERDSAGFYRNDKHVMANIYRYGKEVKPWNQEEIKDLENRGFIRDYNRYQGSSEKRTLPEYFEIEESFKRLLVQPPYRLGEELWRRYPNWLHVDGRRVTAKNADKDELIKKYHRIIQGSQKYHEKVMEALEYQKKYDLLNMGIEKYVGSRQWENVMDEIGKGGNGDDYIVEESRRL